MILGRMRWLSPCLFLLFLAACGGGGSGGGNAASSGGSTPSNAVVVTAQTKMLDQTAAENLVVSTDRSTLTLPSASAVAQSVVPGDVLAIGSTTATPGGLLRKVVSVSQSGSNIVVSTTQGTLADVL